MVACYGCDRINASSPCQWRCAVAGTLGVDVGDDGADVAAAAARGAWRGWRRGWRGGWRWRGWRPLQRAGDSAGKWSEVGGHGLEEAAVGARGIGWGEPGKRHAVCPCLAPGAAGCSRGHASGAAVSAKVIAKVVLTLQVYAGGLQQPAVGADAGGHGNVGEGLAELRMLRDNDAERQERGKEEVNGVHHRDDRRHADVGSFVTAQCVCKAVAAK